MAVDAGIANGRKPSGMPAACLYAVGREQLASYTQEELAEVAGVSSPTLRARLEELRGKLEQ